MKIMLKIILFSNIFHNIICQVKFFHESIDIEDQKIEVIKEIVVHNLKTNGWHNIYFIGNLPDALYTSLCHLNFTFSVTGINEYDEQIRGIVPYNSNIIIFNCDNLEEFENAIRKAITLSYWHSLANIILYYHAPYEKKVIAKIFFAFWFHRAINVIIVQYENAAKEFLISHYNPYMSEYFRLDNLYGCWTARKISMPIENFNEGLVCVKECHNVSMHSKLRTNFLGTCIGFDTEAVPLNKRSEINNMQLFEDKSKNLHGYTLLAYAIEVLPFLGIEVNENGTNTLLYRDGKLWNTMAELFNFKIDLFPSKDKMKQKFDFEINIQYVISFTLRKADLILFPLYQFDLVIADIDYTVPFLDSGVCVLSNRAEYETLVFDKKLLQRNMLTLIEFFICFLCLWFVFFLFNIQRLEKISLDQAGKDLINTFRMILSISLSNLPQKASFRIFFTISIWCFFILNFSTQASIISLFSVHKRGKEVDTFEEIIEKGYKIEGIASPDVVLPDDEEKFVTITSRMEVAHDLFECVNRMLNDSRRFCLMDCGVGRYLARNMLNEKGEQFLHVASEARIHSHYLNMIFHKNCPLTERYNRYIMYLFEAGIIGKWMDYRYFDSNEEAPLKSLGMEDLGGVFEVYIILVGISSAVFLLENFLSLIVWVTRRYFKK